MLRPVHRSRLAGTALAVLATAALSASSAQAGEPSPACPAQTPSRPFLPWLDVADYVPVPGGNVEPGGVAWTLTGAAAAVEGNEPYNVGGATDHVSMRLAPGSSATTAAACISPEHPTLRFFARRTGGWLLNQLLVEAVVSDAAGIQRSMPVGTVTSLGNWAPSLPLPNLTTVVSTLAEGGTLPVAFRFTPLDGAQWSVDDVYVDPFRVT